MTLLPLNLVVNWPVFTILFRLIVPQPWDLTKKRSIIASRKSTMRFPSSHRLTVYVTHKSPKGWLKTRFFTFGVDFISSLHAIVDTSNLECGLNIASPSLSNGYVSDDRGWPVSTVTWISTFCVASCIFVIGDRKDSKLDVKVECASHSLRTTNCSW